MSMDRQTMLLRLIIILLVTMVFVAETFGATTKSSKKSTTKSSNKSPTKSKNAKSKNAKSNAKATTAKPIASLDCDAAYDAINDCLYKPAQEESLNLYYYYLYTGDDENTLNLLKKLKNKDCIKASAWPDIQAYLAISARPEPMINIYKKLTKKEKKITLNYMNDEDNKKLFKQWSAIMEEIAKEMQELSQADQKIIDDWNAANSEACGW